MKSQTIKSKSIDQEARVSVGVFVGLFVLWLAVMVSALGVVYSTYNTRIKFNELEVLRREHNRLQIAWGQYLLEKSTWASFGRIEKIASEELNMVVPSANQIVKVFANEG